MSKTVLGVAPFVECPSLEELKAAGWSHDSSQDFKLAPTPMLTLGNEIALAQLAAVMSKITRLETRYMELHLAARRCLRYNGVDPARFNESMRAMDALIQRHIGEIDEMDGGE